MVRPRLTEEEIEQKLRSTRHPQPPAKLLEQLKAGIPEKLPYSAGGRTSGPTFRNTWAVAASILALIGMSYVMVTSLESNKSETAVDVVDAWAKESTEPTAARVPAQPSAAGARGASLAGPGPHPSGSEQKVQATTQDAAPDARVESANAIERDEYRPQMNDEQFALESMTARPEGVAADSARERSDDQRRVGGVVGGAVTQSAERAVEEGDPINTSAAAPAAPPPAVMPAPEPPLTGRMVDRGAAAGAAARGSARLRMMGPAKSAGGGQFVDAEADPVSTFNLLVADDSFSAIRSAIATGRLPDPGRVREEEVVNHFDYRDDVARADITLSAEGSPGPFDATTHVMRIGVRTRTGGGAQPLALGAKIQVDFNPAIVSSYRLVGYESAEGAGQAVAPSNLPYGHSVSAIYELKLERRPARRDRIARVRLQYLDPVRRSRTDILLETTGGDFVATWDAAAPSLRLASLAAKWAELLKGSPFAAAVDPRELFARAQRLSGELAGDEAVAEFVSLAAQTAKLMGR